MKQSEALELVQPGTLKRPGPIGRAVRLTLGALILYGLANIVQHAGTIVARPFSSLDNLVILIAVALCVFNYVVNIGFGRNWGWRPLLTALVVLALAAAGGFLATGSLDSAILGVPLVLWLGYFYAHLGISFVLAAILATPGCEMRSIPEALGRIRGQPTQEHHCPAAFIAKIDAWERRLRNP